ncbi:MAG TPA: hypothetical protein DIW07_01305 [Lachnospiraceae bacterium]|jgi:hypothetical protein|nr:hypothetical protein [Lachnospiraceae bacterium]
MSIYFRVDGMEKLIKSIEELGKVPQKYVTSASRKAMTAVQKVSKEKAPYETGNLRKGIILRGEKSHSKGKKVYRIIFDPRMNDIFQKKSGKYGEVKGYYPVSQEYGYFSRSGNYIPGFRFVHKSFKQNTRNIESTIIGTMQTKIDAELRKAGLK